MFNRGDKIVPKSGNSLSDFTAFKSYTVIAGHGDLNVSPAAIKLGTHLRHSETSCNVKDDKGNIRFVTSTYFTSFKDVMGLG